MSSSKETILIVEDEEALGEGLLFNFEAEGFDVRWKKDGLEAMSFIQESHGELTAIVLDIMLPEMDGFEILQRTRDIAKQIPILVLSAKGLESDKVRALELGADDYVTKPFSLVELILRVKALARKRKWYKSFYDDKSIPMGRATFNTQNLTLESADGTVNRISPTEATLIQTFVTNENRILTRGELLKRVWNHEAGMETRTVDVFVGKLRKYIEENPAKPHFLISVRGVGYVYVTDESMRAELVGK